MIFLKAKWENIVMANYEVDSEILRPFLPKGVELDYYNGKTYVSLVGFMFKETKIFGVPIPKFGTFEEVNLRFYVTRKDKNVVKRGVVFINETVPYKAVAWLANYLYKEHYITIPTKHNWSITKEKKHIEYQWKINNKWNNIFVETSTIREKMQPKSIEEFIFEHYFGYTKTSDETTEEYKIIHPSWEINKINNYKINCDFEAMYGKEFRFLSYLKPNSIMMAEGSSVSVKWKRNKF